MYTDNEPDIGCRLHILVKNGDNEMNYYDVGVIELERILKHRLDTAIVSYGKYGAYMDDFRRELAQIDLLRSKYENFNTKEIEKNV